MHPETASPAPPSFAKATEGWATPAAAPAARASHAGLLAIVGGLTSLVLVATVYGQLHDTNFYALCEALLDYDERFLRLRFEHVVLVERALGGRARGTGGTAISYLQRTLRYRFFPELWDVRSLLSVRGGGELTR